MRDQKAYIEAMWILFLRAPGQPHGTRRNRDLGEVGSVKEKGWQRATPYSLAIKVSGIKFKNGSPLLAFVNDLEESAETPFFWQKWGCPANALGKMVSIGVIEVRASIWRNQDSTEVS
jgi:hypothetical protein